MELTVFSLSSISILAIIIMVSTIVIAYFKKIMMTYALIIANLIVFFLSIIFRQEIIGELGFRPVYLSVEFSPQIYTLFTAMFVHADALHLLGNMLVFFFMGIAFEDRIGWKPFLLIYLITGICGSLTHAMLNLDPGVSSIPLVGASGAIFGILGAFAYAYPWDEVVMPIPIGIMFIMKIKVLYAAILFSIMETVFVFLGGQTTTAHFAHFGGLVSGVVIAAAMIGRRKEQVTPKGKRMQYETTNSQYGSRPREIDYTELREVATTPKLHDMLARVEKENVAQVRDIWLEHFLSQVRCPVCGKPLQHSEHKLFCEDHHFSKAY